MIQELIIAFVLATIVIRTITWPYYRLLSIIGDYRRYKSRLLENAMCWNNATFVQFKREFDSREWEIEHHSPPYITCSKTDSYIYSDKIIFKNKAMLLKPIDWLLARHYLKKYVDVIIKKQQTADWSQNSITPMEEALLKNLPPNP